MAFPRSHRWNAYCFSEHSYGGLNSRIGKAPPSIHAHSFAAWVLQACEQHGFSKHPCCEWRMASPSIHARTFTVWLSKHPYSMASPSIHTWYLKLFSCRLSTSLYTAISKPLHTTHSNIYLAFIPNSPYQQRWLNTSRRHRSKLYTTIHNPRTQI